MREIKIGLIGFGTIGKAVYGALKKNSSLLSANLGAKVILKGLCDKDRSAFKGYKLNKKFIKKNANEIINDPDIDIVIELIGGIKPAKNIVLKALKNKKNVITANKALLADNKAEIFEAARKNSVGVYFEASVMAGVPVIRALKEGLAGCRPVSLWGIINGTSNYILSKMYHENKEFKEALVEAQQKGFAEAKYLLDVEGVDSAHKLAILASLAFRRDIKIKDIHVEGMSDISLGDIAFAKEMGYSIKLLAIAKKKGNQVDVRVHPALLPAEHLLSDVNDAYNGLYMQSDLARNVFLYGEGAGGASTSAAVLADVVDAARSISSQKPAVMPELSGKKISVRKVDDISFSYYIRFMAVDKPGVLAKASSILAKHSVSIASVMQKARNRSQAVPIIMLTHSVKSAKLNKALKEINKLSVIKNRPVAIRIEEVA